MSSNLCENCHARQKFVDLSTGIPYPYCGKSCGTAAKQKLASLCLECYARPRCTNGTHVHDYCSRSCAQKAASRSGGGNNGQSSQSGAKFNPHVICQIPGCTKPAHKNTDGSLGKYCNLTHKDLAEKACLYCRKTQKLGNRHFCSRTCTDECTKKGPMLLEVPKDHATFKDVEAQFKTSWRQAGKPCPPVRYVYKIVSNQASLDKYNAYRDAVEARGHFKASGHSAGNENRRWHGTKRECKIGNKGRTNFCSSSSCLLCCILKTSFDVNKCSKKNGGGGSFGAGIYTSSTSSMADMFSKDTDTKAPLKAIFLSKVVVGRGCKMTQSSTALIAPPPGFDSVLAEKGTIFANDELVVYSNDAIRPSYLVMYDAN